MINSHNKKCRGFTLVELLVVISIIALLMSILMPVLGKAKAQARKVVCLSNMRQIGLGINLYIASNQDAYPQQVYPWGAYNTPQEQAKYWWFQVHPYINIKGDKVAVIGADASRDSVGHCPNHEENRTEKYYSYRGNRHIMTALSGGPMYPNRRPIMASNVRHPSDKILVYETHTPAHLPGTSDYIEGWLKAADWDGHAPVLPWGFPTHDTLSNFLFSDGHVASVRDTMSLKNLKKHWYPTGRLQQTR